MCRTNANWSLKWRHPHLSIVSVDEQLFEVLFSLTAKHCVTDLIDLWPSGKADSFSILSLDEPCESNFYLPRRLTCWHDRLIFVFSLGNSNGRRVPLASMIYTDSNVAGHARCHCISINLANSAIVCSAAYNVGASLFVSSSFFTVWNHPMS